MVMQSFTVRAAFLLPQDYYSRCRDLPAAEVVRQRRSAVDFDGQTYISSGQFCTLVDAVMVLEKLLIKTH